ncbi:hypothetical protein BKA82DRAFT_998736 [Pisolithus tinctorius]|uniref:Uncharacterized protein n=1 Tax=Pisolithus tinctorius Marx 270 TaxID=870435 RepID=A0A0C3P0I6_PISTI|nr:hypothetical protein BKA82DRAFT_998736 [Pisolithus tinctorius]KIO06605.1 hypothetical protein M404DRAFT_998736 [Pisolithus tinctorius Marx 270]
MKPTDKGYTSTRYAPQRRLRQNLVCVVGLCLAIKPSSLLTVTCPYCGRVCTTRFRHSSIAMPPALQDFHSEDPAG